MRAARWATKRGWLFGRRPTAVLLAAALVASCGGGGDQSGSDAEDDEQQIALPDSTTTIPLVEVSVGDALAMAGIAVVVEPGGRPVNDPSSPAAPIEMWEWQVDNLAREHDEGVGYLGLQVDELVGDIEGLPFSALVAAWLRELPTPTSRAARYLVGEQSLDDHAAVVYPTVVLTLFATDVAAELERIAGANDADEDAGGRTVDVLLPVGFPRQTGGVCSTLSGWVNSVLTALFDALTIEIDADSSFGWLADIWNAAVALVEAIVTGLIKVLTAPIVNAIAQAVGVVGVLSMVASLLQPWSLDVSPDDGTLSFAVGDGPAVNGAFTAAADTNLPDIWPAEIVDCAKVAGLTLPDPSSTKGAEVAWTVAGFPDLGSETSRDMQLNSQGTARLRFVTGREETDTGPPRHGQVGAAASVTPTAPAEVQAMLTMLITDQVPIPPFDALVGSLFEAITEPIFEGLAELVAVKGASAVSVEFHDPDPCGVPSGELPAGRWEGLWWSYNATREGENRQLMPIRIEVDSSGTVTGTGQYHLHGLSVDSMGYALSTTSGAQLEIQGDASAFTIRGSYGVHWVFDSVSSPDSPFAGMPPGEHTEPGSIDTTFEVEGVTTSTAGVSNRGDGFAGGVWLVRDPDSSVRDLSRAGIEVSLRHRQSLDLPDRPGDSSGLAAANADLDAAVEAFRSGRPDECSIEPIVYWASVTRGVGAR